MVYVPFIYLTCIIKIIPLYHRWILFWFFFRELEVSFVWVGEMCDGENSDLM